MCNSVKGDSYLEIAIIDKDGKKIKDIGKIQANTQANSFKPLSFDIPKELSGIGFIAFIARGDINNRSVFKVSNIETVSYTHLTLPTILRSCRSRWSPYH